MLARHTPPCCSASEKSSNASALIRAPPAKPTRVAYIRSGTVTSDPISAPSTSAADATVPKRIDCPTRRSCAAARKSR
jgi:hypothetical protein